MSEAKHTPGPWDVNGIDTEKIRIGSRKMSDVAIVYNQPNRFDGSLSKSRKRNAELIAAAPDLLAACELVERWMLGGQPGPFSDQKILEIVGAAIAKAKGE
jgi:hypothetical protein